MNKPEKILEEVKASMDSLKTAVNTIAKFENLFREVKKYLKQDEKNIKKSTLKSLLELEDDIHNELSSVYITIDGNSYYSPLALFDACCIDVLDFDYKTGEITGFSKTATERQKALCRFANAYEFAKIINKYGSYNNIPSEENFLESFDPDVLENDYDPDKIAADFNAQDFNEFI